MCINLSAQDTNTNDAANGAISCVFYDIQILGRYQRIGDILPLLVHVYLLTVTLLCAILQTGPLRVVKLYCKMQRL